MSDPYETALAVQNACNLSGVVHAFAEVLSELGKRGLNERSKRMHASTTMFISKICNMIPHIADPVDFGVFNAAYEVCKKPTKSATVDYEWAL